MKDVVDELSTASTGAIKVPKGSMRKSVDAPSFQIDPSCSTSGREPESEENEGKNPGRSRKTPSTSSHARQSSYAPAQSKRSHRRLSADTSQIRAVGSALNGVSASQDFQVYMSHRLTFANMLHDGKLPTYTFQEFSAGVALHPWYLYFRDDKGKVLMGTERQYLQEWWKMVRFWLRKLFILTLIGHIFLVCYSMYSDERLGVIRILIRAFAFLVLGGCVLLEPKLSVFNKRKLVTGALFFYLYFAVIIIDQQNLPILLSGDGYFHVLPCDYAECLATTNPNQCVPNSLPYVVAQASVAVTIFRIPFVHTTILLCLVTVFYVGTSVVVQSDSLKNVTTASWELCPLCLAFFCLVLSAMRGELLSRFLFIQARVKFGDKNEKSDQDTDDKHLDMSETSTALGTESSLGWQSYALSPISFTVRVQRRLNYWMGLFVKKFFSRVIFMSFENKIMRDSDAMCWQTIQFFNAEMEYCFLSARLKVAKKYSLYSLAIIVVGFTYLTVDDVLKYMNRETQTGVLEGMVKNIFIVRVALRVVFLVIAFITICLFHCMTDIYHLSFCLLTSTFVFFVITIVSDPEMLEVMVGVNMCEGHASTECANRLCFSILAFLTATFSWVLVQLRLKFHHVWATLISVCFLFLLLRVIANLELGAVAFFCLLIAAVCFTVGAYRIDVTARALFCIEWERVDRIKEEVTPDKSNVTKVIDKAKRATRLMLSRPSSPFRLRSGKRSKQSFNSRSASTIEKPM